MADVGKRPPNSFRGSRRANEQRYLCPGARYRRRVVKTPPGTRLMSTLGSSSASRRRLMATMSQDTRDRAVNHASGGRQGNAQIKAPDTRTARAGGINRVATSGDASFRAPARYGADLILSGGDSSRRQSGRRRAWRAGAFQNGAGQLAAVLAVCTAALSFFLRQPPEWKALVLSPLKRSQTQGRHLKARLIVCINSHQTRKTLVKLCAPGSQRSIAH